jgi:drug/metabolite transporter (DMT)-like permease
MSIKNYKAAAALAIFCTLLWGTAFPFIKAGYAQFGIEGNDIGSKLLFAGARFTLAGIMVLFIFLVKNKHLPKIEKNGIMPVMLLGSVQTFGQYIFTYIGIGFTSGANTSVITACATFFTVLFAPLFFKSDKLNICKIIGCVLGFCGVLCVNSGGGVTADTLFGDFMILMSTLSAAAGNFISKGIVRDREPISVTGFQLLFGGILLLIAGFVTGGKLDFSSIKGLLVLLWLAFVSAAAFAIWTALLKHHHASRICVFNLLVPVFGTLLSGIMLGESVFGIEMIVSVVLICAGIFISNMQIKKRCER